jgi:hypothetical protein
LYPLGGAVHITARNGDDIAILTPKNGKPVAFGNICGTENAPAAFPFSGGVFHTYSVQSFRLFAVHFYPFKLVSSEGQKT